MAFNDIITGFRVQSNEPIDSRLICEDLAARNAIPAGARYEGLQTYVKSEQKIFILQGGVENTDFIDIADGIVANGSDSSAGESGYSHTGAFADKPLDNNYVWESGAGLSYSQADVDAEKWKVFSLEPSSTRCRR